MHGVVTSKLHAPTPSTMVVALNSERSVPPCYRSAVELSRIVTDSMDSMFGFSLRVPPATAQRLTAGIDAVVQKCALQRQAQQLAN